ncbi:MAG: hypothetical protein CBB84_000075 [Phycisphaera sp. TMED24]|nr:MAG: hypothetical protein CBB84_000075 [Phycisphaera sp. TMED24]
MVDNSHNENGETNISICLSFINKLINDLLKNKRRNDKMFLASVDTLSHDWARITMHIVSVQNLRLELLYVFYLASVKNDSSGDNYAPIPSKELIEYQKEGPLKTWHNYHHNNSNGLFVLKKL